MGHKYLGANQNCSEYTIIVPAGISHLVQGSPDSRGIISVLQQILQNTKTKLSRLSDQAVIMANFSITILKHKNFVLENTVKR